MRYGVVFGQKVPCPLHTHRSEEIPNTCIEYVPLRGVSSGICQGRGWLYPKTSPHLTEVYRKVAQTIQYTGVNFSRPWVQNGAFVMSWLWLLHHWTWLKKCSQGQSLEKSNYRSTSREEPLTFLTFRLPSAVSPAQHALLSDGERLVAKWNLRDLPHLSLTWVHSQPSQVVFQVFQGMLYYALKTRPWGENTQFSNSNDSFVFSKISTFILSGCGFFGFKAVPPDVRPAI